MKTFFIAAFKSKPVALTAKKAKELAEEQEKKKLISLKKETYENLVQQINYAVKNGIFYVESAISNKCLDILPEFEKLGYGVEIIFKDEYRQDEFPAIKITWK